MESSIIINFKLPHKSSLNSGIEEVFKDSHCLFQDDSPEHGSGVYQRSPVPSWTIQQTCQWLHAIGMDKYVHVFSSQQVDGNTLLSIDNNRLKVSTKKLFLKK